MPIIIDREMGTKKAGREKEEFIKRFTIGLLCRKW
jgi:hypothetical protein